MSTRLAAAPVRPTSSRSRGPRRRIAYVLSQFPCYDETFILREMKALAEHGIELLVFSLRHRRQPVIHDDAGRFLLHTRYAAYVFSAATLGATLRTLVAHPGLVAGFIATLARSTWRRPMTLLKSLAFVPKALRFADLARAEGIEHLHAHWATYPATVAMLMARITGVSWSFTCHAHDIFHDPSLLPEKLADCEFALTCTANNKSYLETVSPYAASRVRVSYHGLDLARFRPREGARPAGPLRLLAVGSLLPCKGFEYLIEACRLLRARDVDFHLSIAGGGPLDSALKTQAAVAGLQGRVRFIGYVKQEAIVNLYREADLFVLPAVLEIHWGIPNVVVEALACALPVITTALPSLPELLEDGVHGIVAANKDAHDLAAKIERLAGDSSLRASMGLAGRERVVELFDLERTIATVVEPLVGRP